jgi:hypothetical protein
MYRERTTGTRFPNNSSCPLCDSLAYSESDPRTGALLFVCSVCGKYRFTEEASELLIYLRRYGGEGRYKLSHAMRRAAERAFGKKDNTLYPLYSSDDLQKILDRPDAPVQEKLNLLLSFLGSLSEYPGQCAEFDSRNDYTVLGAKNNQEADFYLDSLVQQGLVLLGTPHIGRSEARFTVSAKGWMELERIAQSGKESTNAFIAMWFDPSRSEFDAAISGAIEDAGYIPIRIDRIEHLNRIDDEIIARIRQSKFLVADFSGQRNGVYFEAGFMLGLGRPVIWVCEEVELNDIHFDTRQYNTILYKSADDLRTHLQFRIEANLGKGPHLKNQER